MKYIKVILILVLFISYAHAQKKTIAGSLANWNHGDALIIGDSKHILGKVSGDGQFSMELKNEVDVPYLSDWFSCPGTDLSSTNMEQSVGLPSVSGAFMLKESEKDRFNIASMVPSSSQEFAKFIAHRGRISAVIGYSINYYYVEQSANLEGICSRERKSGKNIINTSRTYDLNFKPGWNLVQFEIKEVYTNSAGIALPKVISYKTLDRIPENLKYHIILSTQKFN